jgi:peptidoglycan hydrolase-like protein with peptidoglycan-binding domain
VSRTKQVFQVAVAVVGVAVLAAGAVVGLQKLGDRADDETEATNPEISTASAAVASLTRTLEASGTIEYEIALVVDSPSSGTVLEIVEPGDTVSSGDVLARIDDQVIVWLAGEIPAWRSLTVGDEGDDVEQLERALTELGFNDGTVTVDDEYTSATADMVERWQDSLGVEPTGAVALGSVVYTGDRNRVAKVEAGVGDRVSAGPLISLGTDIRIATLDVDPADGVHLKVGDAVEAMLPDRTLVTATVVSVVETAEVWTVTATIDDGELPERDTIAVDASWQRTIADDVLTIPSSALLRLDNGAYVVDVVDESGDFDRRQVALGASVGTRTEIVSGLAAGDEVVVL